LWNTYKIDGHWRVGGGLNFRGKTGRHRSVDNEPGHITADLMAEYTWSDGRYTIKADLSNVTNELYADQFYSGHYIPGAGRLLMVTGTIKF
jgi:catecholate siderophore receptor